MRCKFKWVSNTAHNCIALYNISLINRGFVNNGSISDPEGHPYFDLDTIYDDIYDISIVSDQQEHIGIIDKLETAIEQAKKSLGENYFGDYVSEFDSLMKNKSNTEKKTMGQLKYTIWEEKLDLPPNEYFSIDANHQDTC